MRVDIYREKGIETEGSQLACQLVDRRKNSGGIGRWRERGREKDKGGEIASAKKKGRERGITFGLPT